MVTGSDTGQNLTGFSSKTLPSFQGGCVATASQQIVCTDFSTVKLAGMAVINSLAG